MALESTIVASITKAARAAGWWVMKIHGGPYQMSGVPDLLCIKGGVTKFLEVKQPGKRPTDIQSRRMNEIETVGGVFCHVVTSREQAMKCLEGEP